MLLLLLLNKRLDISVEDPNSLPLMNIFDNFLEKLGRQPEMNGWILNIVVNTHCIGPVSYKISLLQRAILHNKISFWK